MELGSITSYTTLSNVHVIHAYRQTSKMGWKTQLVAFVTNKQFGTPELGKQDNIKTDL
jgi:hypothetical protein